MNKTTIKQALELFKISRTSLYNHMKKLNIKPIKEAGRVHLMDNHIADLQAVLQPTCKPVNKRNGQREQAGQVEHSNELKKVYEKQIKELKKELETRQEKIEGLMQDVGRWEGRARTLEEQNQKLLSFTPEKEESNEIVEVEIVEPEPAPEKKAEKSKKQGFFQKLFKIKY